MERPRCSARAASRSASTAGMTTVRRTKSSLSQASSGTSLTCSPFLVDAVRRPGRDIPAQDAVTEQAKAAQVREARPLGQPGEDREVKRRGQGRHRQSDVDPLVGPGPRQGDVDPLLEPGPGRGVTEPAERLAAEQCLEPASMEADRHDDQVVGDALTLVTVLDGDDDLLVARVDLY